MPIDITMPRLSDTMERGTIIKWNVKEGDEVSSGDAIADIETDKATMEMQVYDDGKISKLLIEEGKTVDVGTKIAELAADDEDAADATDADDAKAAPAEAPRPSSRKDTEPKDEPKQAKRREPAEDDQPESDKREAKPAKDEDKSGSEGGGHRMRISPVARRIADEHGINVSSIQGSGPHGRVIKRDVLEAVEAGHETAAAVPPSARGSELATPVREKRAEPADAGLASFHGKTIELSNMRQIIAKRLVESVNTIPHYQVTMTFDVDALLHLRTELNEQLEPHSIRLSVNDFFIRACALSIHDHPEFNSSWNDTTLEVHDEVNIGMAIALPAEKGGGLLVGSIRNADQKSLRQISAEAKYLANKARTRGLSPEEMQGSTFTISNLGMFGVEHFTAIINPPNAAIMALGGAMEKPVVRNGQIVVGNELTATLSLDHRILDGAMGAAYMQTLKRYIESPATLLV